MVKEIYYYKHYWSITNGKVCIPVPQDLLDKENHSQLNEVKDIDPVPVLYCYEQLEHGFEYRIDLKECTPYNNKLILKKFGMVRMNSGIEGAKVVEKVREKEIEKKREKKERRKIING